MPGPITRPLLEAILAQYALDPDGPHGILHWARVLENGRRLARSTHAVGAVVELFAVFHDACRENDDSDRRHGWRGARLAERLRPGHIDLPDAEFELLVEACEGHTRGGTSGDVTVLTCWDADRLDLGRVGIRPDPARLGTAPARDRATIAWAHRRATSRAQPELLRREWRLRGDGTFRS
jgi:uncharacterized protein